MWPPKKSKDLIFARLFEKGKERKGCIIQNLRFLERNLGQMRPSDTYGLVRSTYVATNCNLISDENKKLKERTVQVTFQVTRREECSTKKCF